LPSNHPRCDQVTPFQLNTMYQPTSPTLKKLHTARSLACVHVPASLSPHATVRVVRCRLAWRVEGLHPSRYSDEKVANRNATVGHGATENPLNDGQTPNPNVVRVAPGTGYHRVEGNRRAWRNGPVSDLPPEIPTVTTRHLFIAVRRGGAGRRTAMQKLQIVILLLRFGTARQKMVLE
jgi:hypothetical protein